MLEEITEEPVEEKKEEKVKKTQAFTADYVSDVYAFFHQTSSTGEKVGVLEVDSTSGKYNLEGKNFNWDVFIKVFGDTITPDMIKDLIADPQHLRVPVGQQYEGQKNYYKIEILGKKEE